MLIRLVFAVLLFLPAPVQAADIAGPARVIHGDTIEVHDQRNRLHGIDAPESRQPCSNDGEDPTAFVLSANVHRRNLTTGQRAMAVAMIRPEPEKLKRKQNATSGDHGVAH